MLVRMLTEDVDSSIFNLVLNGKAQGLVLSDNEVIVSLREVTVLQRRFDGLVVRKRSADITDDELADVVAEMNSLKPQVKTLEASTKGYSYTRVRQCETATQGGGVDQDNLISEMIGRGGVVNIPPNQQHVERWSV